MIEVTCETCQGEFSIQDDAKNPVKCKLCQSPVDVPELRKRDTAAAKKGPKCPACGKRWAPGAKFCAACGTSTVDPGAAQVAAFEADLEVKKRVSMHRIKAWLYRWF